MTVLANMERRLSAEEAGARAFVYRAAQCITAGYPTLENMRIIFGETAEDCIARFASNSALKTYKSHRAGFNENPKKWIDHERDAYTHLFIGPQDLAALPWESCYVGEGRMIFQDCVLQVRAAYRERGFKIASNQNLPDDHIALELGFMAELAARDAEGDRPAADSFLHEHLMEWIPSYEKAMDESGASGFYPDAIAFIADFCAADAARRELQPVTA